MNHPYDDIINLPHHVSERHPQMSMSESDAEVLNRKLAYLQSLDEKPTISVTYFMPDDKKEGGSYHTATGIVKSVEPDKGVLQFEDGTGIPVIRIKDIDGECFLTE